MNVEFGKQNILGSRFSGGSGCTPQKFSRPPIVVCQLVRSFEHGRNWALYINICNITKDGFQYLVKGHYKQGINVIG